MKKLKFIALFALLIITTCCLLGGIMGCSPKDKIIYNHDETEQQEKIMYTVHFDSDGGSSIEDVVVEKGYACAKPENPVKDNRDGEYVFKCWCYGEQEWNFNNKINGNITLKAKWELKSRYTKQYTD